MLSLNYVQLDYSRHACDSHLIRAVEGFPNGIVSRDRLHRTHVWIYQFPALSTLCIFSMFH